MATNLTPDSTENKLILLFVLDKMEIPLTENSIIDICTSTNSWLKYMDCKDALWQLIDVNFIYKTLDCEGENRYNITMSGRACLSHFAVQIRAHLREEITKFANENRMKFKRAQEYISKYAKNTDGTHTVTLKIIDPLESQNLFEIKMKMSSRKQAIVASNKWKEKAPQIYEMLYDMLGESE